MDIRILEERVAQAREALAADRFEEAAELFSAALALWRGDPFDGLGYSYLRRYRDWLDEQRQILTEEWLAAEIAAGHPERVVPDLRRAVSVYPLRERMHELLILALCQVDRQAEALASYQRARQTLIAELGVEPGPSLQALQRRLLAGDPSLFKSSAALRSERVNAPAQLPPDERGLVGREDELDHLVRRLAGGGCIAGIFGPVGAGKSALAIRAAHLLRTDFPDGQFYATLSSSDGERVDSCEVLGDFLRGLGISPSVVPDSPGGRMAMWRSAVSDRRVLIVLDDVHDGCQVMPLIPGTSAASVIITSWHRLSDVPGIEPMTLGALCPTAAVALVRRFAGQARRSDDSDAGYLSLASACAFLPLALRAAGATHNARPTHPIENVVRSLQARPKEIELVDRDQAVMDRRYRMALERLDPAVARAARLLAVPDWAEIGTHSAAILLGTGRERTGCILDALAADHLLVSSPGHDYAFSGPTQAALRRQVLRLDGPDVFGRIEALSRSLKEVAT